jgi:hypothetical protein
LDRRLDGPQSRSGRGGEETPGLEPPIIQPFAQNYTTELCIVLYIYVTRACVSAFVCVQLSCFVEVLRLADTPFKEPIEITRIFILSEFSVSHKRPEGQIEDIKKEEML